MTWATLILALLLARLPLDVEIGVQAALHGVDPALGYAVCRVETWGLAEPDRLTARGPGGVSVCQVHPLHAARCGDLSDRHVNIACAMGILASEVRAARARSVPESRVPLVAAAGYNRSDRRWAFAAVVVQVMRAVRPGRSS